MPSFFGGKDRAGAGAVTNERSLAAFKWLGSTAGTAAY